MGYLVIGRRINERILLTNGADKIEILISDIRNESGQLIADVATKAPKKYNIKKIKKHIEE